jgi:hypothetical protein
MQFYPIEGFYVALHETQDNVEKIYIYCQVPII